MKLLTSKEIKKIMYGVLVSDGHLQKVGNTAYRFDLYSCRKEYVDYIHSVLTQVTGMEARVVEKKGSRGYVGYRVFTKTHPYWSTFGEKVYSSRKALNTYVVSRLNEESLAHIWMGDGYLEHSKNRKLNKVQNIGWLCLEAFPKEELELLQNHLKESFGIESTLIQKPWGFGYRIRIGGKNLQKFISIIYPYILDCFKYKTLLFYKEKESADMNLPSAEQYIQLYECVEDIVRHSQQ